MKKSIKKVLIGVLMVPILSLGVFAIVPAAKTYAVDANGCTTTEIATGVTGCDLKGGASSSNKAGGVTQLFGTGGVLTTVINFALYFIGAISVLMLIIGGVRYTLSGGNDKAVAAAKNTILYAIIGVVIAVLAYAIVNFVLGTFAAPTA